MLIAQTRCIQLLAVAGVLAACSTAMKVDKQSEEQAIRELNTKVLDAMAKKDAAAVTSYFAENAVGMPSNEPQVTGRAAIGAWWSNFFKAPNSTISFVPTKIEVAESGDLAYDVGTYRLAMDTPQGRMEDEGKYTTVWKKMNGEWKIDVDIANSNKPLPAPTVVVSESPGALAAPAEPMAAHVHAAELTWTDAPPALPPGAKIAVLEGNPMEPGPFTFRLKFPANYAIPPHFHPVIEHVTVLSGTLHIGKGEQWDPSQFTTLVAGDFAHMSPGTPHFAHAPTETVLQLHSTGPWGITYVNAKDDPRTK